MTPNVYVYIAGPYTSGDVAQNVHAAIAAANAVVEMGAYPYIPHLDHFWHLVYPCSYSFWMAQDRAWLARCDLLYRLPGYSKGADEEVQIAVSLGIPVIDSNFGQLQDHVDRIREEKIRASQEAQDVV